MRRQENSHQFFADALGADLVDRRRLRHDRVPRRRLDLELEHRREPHRAQHPQTIFGKALRRIANRADNSLLQIRSTANEIDDLILFGIEEHPVDGEVPPRRVFLGCREMHFDRTPPIEISAIRAKGRDLELESVLEHHDHAEMRPDRVGARKDLLHDFRPRIGGDVDVFRHLTPQQIAHTTARRSRPCALAHAAAARCRAPSIPWACQFSCGASEPNQTQRARLRHLKERAAAGSRGAGSSATRRAGSHSRSKVKRWTINMPALNSAKIYDEQDADVQETHRSPNGQPSHTMEAERQKQQLRARVSPR